ncbi:MAG: MoaD/ThiS family protein [Chloroflexi bacterium]|nr:MoaD/ThiS family protein [Chloroflexota bacterium]
MSVTVTMSDLLRRATGQSEPVQVSAASSLECVQEVANRFPILKKWLYDEETKLKPQVWLSLNGERIYEDEFTRMLKDGDELSIMLAVLGG